MSADHYALFTIRNTTAISLQVTLHDVAGVQVVATLPPGAEMTEAGLIGSTWMVKFAAGAAGETAPAPVPATAETKDIDGSSRGGPTIH